MQSLRNVLAALRREVDAGLPGAGRVVVELDVIGREVAGQIDFVVATTGAAANASAAGADAGFKLRVSVEATRADAGTAGAAGGVATQSNSIAPPAAAKPGVSANEIAFQALCALFGAPGFDSAARACVFREALEGSTEADVAVVAARLQGQREGAVTPEVEKAEQLIGRVVRSGPTRMLRQGGEILVELFARTSVATVLKLVEERWQTQREWMDR